MVREFWYVARERTAINTGDVQSVVTGRGTIIINIGGAKWVTPKSKNSPRAWMSRLKCDRKSSCLKFSVAGRFVLIRSTTR